MALEFLLLLLLHCFDIVGAGLTCGGTYSQMTGSIQFAPISNADVIDCAYVIRSPPGYRVNLNITLFDFSSSKNCERNYIKVYDGDKETYPMLHEYCDSTINPAALRSFGNAMLIQFHSNSSQTATAFQAEYTMGVYQDAFFLIASSKDVIFRMDPATGSNYKVPMSTRLFNPIAVDYDFSENRIYWSEVSAPISTAIRSAYLNGSDVRLVRNPGVDAAIDGLALDSLSRLLFYTDAGMKEIVMVSLRTLEYRNVIGTTTDKPRAIVLHIYKGIMFWTDWGTPAKIERANYDGTDRRILVTAAAIFINAIALDAENDKLYWVDAGTDVVESCDTDGRGRTTLISVDAKYHFFGLALFDGSLYITDWGQDGTNLSSLIRYEIGASNATVVGNVDARMNDIHAHHPRIIYQGPNGCGSNNGGCSKFCIPLPGNSSKCLCPDNQWLTSTNTCADGLRPTTATSTTPLSGTQSETITLVSASPGGDTKDIAWVAGVAAGSGAMFIIVIVVIIVAVIVCRKRYHSYKHPSRHNEVLQENPYSGLGSVSQGPFAISPSVYPVMSDKNSDYCELEDFALPYSSESLRDSYLHPVPNAIQSFPPPCYWSVHTAETGGEYMNPTANPDHTYSQLNDLLTRAWVNESH